MNIARFQIQARTSILTLKIVLYSTFFLLATFSSAAQPVFEIYQTSITQTEIDNWKKHKDSISPEMTEADFISRFIWERLAVEIFKVEAEKRNYVPDPVYVQIKINENRTSMTEAQFNDLKKDEKTLYELKVEFSKSNTSIDDFVKRVWAQRGPELSKLNIAPGPDGLRSYLLMLTADKNMTMIGSKPDALPKTRDELLKQINDPSNSKSFHELMSRIEQLKDAVAGKIACSPDELARGEKYFNNHKANLSTRESFVKGGHKGLLEELKKENLVDRWVIAKMKQDARFHDPVIEQALHQWEAKNRPRHHEVFGSQK